MTPIDSREVHGLALFVHGALALGHALGLVYNLKRRNRWQTGAHLAGVLFSSHATWHHSRHC